MSYYYNGTEGAHIHKRGGWKSQCKNKCIFNYERNRAPKNWKTKLNSLYNGKYWCEANWRYSSDSPMYGASHMGRCTRCGCCPVCKPKGCDK
mmetsp:Transcript_29404/g.25981  ORF Transcript_29404/g.25981 Transcript_29404/m.25981 type:complete len:92 (-) Transcript_29404:221-496(-)